MPATHLKYWRVITGGTYPVKIGHQLNRQVPFQFGPVSVQQSPSPVLDRKMHDTNLSQVLEIALQIHVSDTRFEVDTPPVFQSRSRLKRETAESDR